MLIAIDPGCIESAYVIMRDNYKPIHIAKVKNEELLSLLYKVDNTHKVVIEMIASYGMAVGIEVFETCVWVGRFMEAVKTLEHTRMYRKEVKLNLCQSMKAKDSNIMQALIDRFAQHDFKLGKGTKKNPDWFYGFYKDIWAAYAVGVTYLDKQS